MLSEKKAREHPRKEGDHVNSTAGVLTGIRFLKEKRKEQELSRNLFPATSCPCEQPYSAAATASAGAAGCRRLARTLNQGTCRIRRLCANAQPVIDTLELQKHLFLFALVLRIVGAHVFDERPSRRAFSSATTIR